MCTPASGTSEVIGREDELGRLTRFVERVPEGATALLLEGDAGIGKTTLWQAAVELARTRSYRVLSAQPAEAERGLSFAALNDLVERTLADVRLPGAQRAALEGALLVGEPLEAPLDQHAVSRAFLGLLRSLAAARPVLVAIDDAQWIDRPTARVLEFALRRLETQPVSAIVAVRSSDVSDVPFALDHAFALERIAVAPLSLGAVHHLVRTRLGLTLSRPILLRLHRASGGNPFYALEIARALATAPAPDQALPLPESLRALVRDRLGRLPGRTRRALLAAAALSRPTVPLVQDAVPKLVLADLEKAERGGVIELADDRIRFSHPLFASVHYADAPAAERRRLHRRLAELVAEQEERARHLALAAERPDTAVAATLEEAAWRARARGAPEAAAELLEQALSLTPTGRDEDVRRRTIEAADCSYVAGDARRARALLEPLVARLPAGQGRAEALYRLGVVRQDDFEAVTALCEEALSEAENDLLRISIQRLLSELASNRGDQDQAAARACSAVEIAERQGEAADLALALSQLGLIEFFRGPCIRFDLMERAIELEREAGLAGYYSASTSLGNQLMWSDELETARPWLEEQVRLAAERGDEADRIGVLYHLADLEARAGRLELADRYAEEVLEGARQLGVEQIDAYAWKLRGLVDARRGRLDDGRRAAIRSLERAREIGDRFVVAAASTLLGFIEVAAGDAAAASERLEPVPELLRGSGVGAVGSWVTDAYAYGAEALVALGKLEGAEALLGELEERARAADRPLALAMAARGKALVCAGHRDLDGALAELEAALAQHARRPLPFELGRTLLVKGSVERRARRKADARASLERALDVLEQASAALWAGRARDELQRVGIRRAAQDGLTSAEQRVAELVASGLTNREVAERLFMSVRTVEAHLTRVYRGFGVRSRVELARKLPPPEESAGIPDSFAEPAP